MCIRSLRDCGYRCVCTAACYTGLQESPEMPEQGMERGVSPQWNAKPDVNVE